MSLNTRTVVYIATLVIGGVWAIASVQVGLGERVMPGAGMWPLVVSLALVATSVVGIARGLITPRAADAPPGEGAEIDVAGWTRIAFSVGALAAFIVGFERFGILLPSVVFVALWLVVLGHLRVWKAVCVALVIGVLLYLLFVPVLEIATSDPDFVREWLEVLVP